MIETLVTILHILVPVTLSWPFSFSPVKAVASARLLVAVPVKPRSARRYDGTGSILSHRIGDIMITSMILAVYSTSEYRDETLRDIPAAEETDTPRRPRAKAKTASDAKTAARRPVIQQQKIRPQVTSRPQKLMHKKLMHQKLTHQKRTHQKLTHQKLTHQKRTHPRPTLNQPIP